MSAGFRLDGDRWTHRVAGQPSTSITYNAKAREVRRQPSGDVIGKDVFEVLEALVAEDPTALWVGYLGYACRPDLTARAANAVPDAVWMKAERGVGWPLAEAIPRSGLGLLPKGGATPRPADATRAAYEEAFAEVQRRLRAGDSYEVNLTRRVQLESNRAPEDVYAMLREINPAPYSAHLWHGGTHVLSASPESYMSVKAGRITTRPIKGTTPRGIDESSDRRQRERLASDPRYRAENLMITDLMRNDLSQVCVPGSVEVTSLMKVESYPAVHQLVSTVEGDLGPGTSAVAAVRALFPAGSMTGAPKLRTMEIIDAVEETPRGIYAGALGWIQGDSCELSVIIRSLIRDAGGHWQAGTGGGITVHSDAASEWEESEWKLDRLVSALG